MTDKKQRSINEKLMEVQSKLAAPKGQNNTFGKYKYRSCEDILSAVKPLLSENGLTILLSDDIVMIGHEASQKSSEYEVVPGKNNSSDSVLVKTDMVVGSRFYVKATATLSDGNDTICVTAYARESLDKKGMDHSQVTGATSSYARKYALNGLFAIDDTKDADTDEFAKSTAKSSKKTNSESVDDFFG